MYAVPQPCCAYLRHRAVRLGRDCTYAVRVPGSGVPWHHRCCCVLRPPRVAEGRLFEYDLRRTDCLDGSLPPLQTNAATSLGALRPPAPGATTCLDGVGVAAAPRNASALVSASSAAAALAAVRAASAFTLELWLRPSAADLASPEPRPILVLGGDEGGLQPSGCFDGQY